MWLEFRCGAAHSALTAMMAPTERNKIEISRGI